MEKRGSHIGVIVSFIIFIAFIIFLYALIQPAVTMKQSRGSLLNYLKNALVNNMKSNLTIITINTYETRSSRKNCIKLVSFVSNTNILTPVKIIVLNSTGSSQVAKTSSTDGNDLYIIRTNPDEYFFKIYSSPKFNEIDSSTESPCTSLTIDNPQNNYTIRLIQKYSPGYIFDLNIIKLINDYNSNYQSVKTSFNLTSSENFGFNFTYQNRTSIGTLDKIPSSSEVYSKNFPVLYITENKSLQSGMLTLRVW